MCVWAQVCRSAHACRGLRLLSAVICLLPLESLSLRGKLFPLSRLAGLAEGSLLLTQRCADCNPVRTFF